MSNNKSIQILRGSTSYNPNNVELLDGQPFYSKQSGKFYIGVDGNSKQTFCNESQVDSKILTETNTREAADSKLESKLNAEISRNTAFDDAHNNLKNGTGDCSIVQLSSGTLQANGKYSAALGDYYRTSVPSTVTGDILAIKNIYNKAGLVTNDYIYHDGCIDGDSNFTFSGQIKAGDRNSVFSINSIPKGFDSFIAGGRYNVSIGGVNLTSGYINFNSGYGNTVLGAKNMIDFSDGASNSSKWDEFGVTGSTYNLVNGTNNYLKAISNSIIMGTNNKIQNSSSIFAFGTSLDVSGLTSCAILGDRSYNAFNLVSKDIIRAYGNFGTTFGAARPNQKFFTIDNRGNVRLDVNMSDTQANGSGSFAAGRAINLNDKYYGAALGENLTLTRNTQVLVGASNDTSDTTSVFAVANDGKNIFAVSPDNIISRSKITNIEGRLKNPRLESMYIATSLTYWKQQTPVTTQTYRWLVNSNVGSFMPDSFSDVKVNLKLDGTTLTLSVTTTINSYEQTLTLINNQAGTYERENTYVPDSTVNVTASGSSFFTFCKGSNTLYFPKDTVTLSHIDTWDPSFPNIGISIFYTSNSNSVSVSSVELEILSNSSPSINTTKSNIFNRGQMSTVSYHHSIGSISPSDYIHIEETKNGITRATFDTITSGDYRPIYFDFDKNN